MKRTTTTILGLAAAATSLGLGFACGGGLQVEDTPSLEDTAAEVDTPPPQNTQSSGASAPDEGELVLAARSGERPTVPARVPHQQLDQNAPPDVLEELAAFLFGLEHVVEGRTGTSLPSARGAFIRPGVAVNSAINREFTHIHMEPGPGSQHLVLSEAEFQTVSDAGWAVEHPWSDQLAEEGFVLMMVYAPRDEADLVQIRKIVTAAWKLALSADSPLP